MFDSLTVQSIPTIGFWCLLPIVLIGPKRWAVIAWIAMANLDPSGATFNATSNLGFVSAIRALLIPLFLTWRLQAWRSVLVLRSGAAKLYMGCITYAAISTLWSPFRFSSVKFAFNLIGILLTAIVFEKVGLAKLIKKRHVVVVIVCTLGLAVFQTFVLGGHAFSISEGTPIDEAERLTSFTATQFFAAFITAMICAALWVKPLPGMKNVALVSVLLVALVANGSRIWFAIVLFLLICYWFRSARRSALALGMSFVIVAVVLAIPVFGSSLKLVLPGVESNRIVTLARLFRISESEALTSGTVGFRLSLYEDMIEEIKSGSVPQLLFGRGTSSTGTLLPGSETLDPNRSSHNEWLRVLYEWGLLGFAAWTLLYVAILIRLGHVISRTRSQTVECLLVFMVALGLAMTTENILASAGSVVTMGAGVLFALAVPDLLAAGTNGRGDADHQKVRNSLRAGVNINSLRSGGPKRGQEQ